ncbi:hypothetical protein DNTS_013574 [Danionella cerebrum]|uniref:Uncharacterized protein n=1 Tax=Danionella cerebrum TaxID=2873325 RepID=A0A553N361_9TELE|nr:hypothetical protein DNTS_013574 [Danionella translucida]
MTLFNHVVDRGFNKGRCKGQQRVCPLSSLLDGFECTRQDEHVSYGALGATVPPFGCTFSSAPGQQKSFAVANEEGFLTILNTGEKHTSVLKDWQAHENAVFDIAWVPGANSLVTASGDQMARLWDVTTGDLLGTFKGHQCSLKSVAFSKQETAVFGTGGRDGNIMIWDTRCSKREGFFRQVKQISGAHMKCERNTPQTKKRRGMAPAVDSQQGVTVVLFCDQHKLFSSGAVDGIIKMWDLRKNYNSYFQNPLPLQAYPYPGSCARKLGYSGLTLDSTGSRLFANCTDDNIYMFNTSGLKTSPSAVFSGHCNSSFYVKSSISPDDQFLASGSSDHHAYIWKISHPNHAPVMLQGHCQEVTSVAWCPTDFTKIASCSDDNTVRIWRLQHKRDEEIPTVPNGNVVGWAFRKGQSPVRTPVHPNPVEFTPALGAVRTTPLSSPQLGACAPTGPELPVPSNIPLPSAKLSSPRMPLALQRWINRNASPSQMVLTTAPPAPLSERRAKRRLDTGDPVTPTSGQESNDFSELYPDFKRSRQNLPEEKVDLHALQTEEMLCSEDLTAAEKENSSPMRTDWLSAISQRFRSSSQHDAKTAGSPVAVSPNRMRVLSPAPVRKASSSTPMKKISSYFLKRTKD